MCGEIYVSLGLNFFMEDEVKTELTEKQKLFCNEYVFDFNATRAYKKVYDCEYDAAKVNGCKLLTNTNIQVYITEIQKDLSILSGISKLKVINEFAKMAFNSIASLHNTWIERKDFDTLTEDQRACISEISTKILKKNIGTAQEPEIVDVEYINIKMFDKNKALENINKMLGYNMAQKTDITSAGQSINIILQKGQ